MFQQRSSQYLRCLSIHEREIVRKDFRARYMFTLSKNLDIEADPSRLLQRSAWVFQERLLSRRTLHFSDQLFWECHSSRASETLRLGVWNTQQLRFKEWRLRIKPSFYDVWYGVLHRYLLCDLTYPSDRLVAIGAVAKEFEHRLNELYCAGLWRGQMPGALLWGLEPERATQQPPKRPKKYRCPTWSWASLDFSGGQRISSAVDSDFRNQVFDNLVEVVDIEIGSPLDKHYTYIVSARIVLRGRLGIALLQSFAPLGRHGCWPKQPSDALMSYIPGHIFDLGPQAAESHDIYLLPVLAQMGSIEPVYALLLKASAADATAFERVGVAVVTRDDCFESMRWVFDVRGEGGLPHELILV
jgi:hypothetical protein